MATKLTAMVRVPITVTIKKVAGDSKDCYGKDIDSNDSDGSSESDSLRNHNNNNDSSNHNDNNDSVVKRNNVYECM